MGQARSILALSIKHNLTFYDAAYLNLVLRTALPFATLDGQLIDAAKTEGVALIL